MERLNINRVSGLTPKPVEIVIIRDELEFEAALERALALHDAAPGSAGAAKRDALLRGLADYDAAVDRDDVFLLGACRG